MFKKIALAFAALGLATSMPAAAEARPNVSFELRIGSPYQFNKHKQYRHYPRCNRWEVAVKHPHRHNRYICVSREDYRQYWREDYRYGPRHDRQWSY